MNPVAIARLDEKQRALVVAVCAFLSFVLFIIFYAEVIYSYGAGVFAFLAAVVATGVALEIRSRRTVARKVVGGAALLGFVLAVAAFVGSIIDLTRPENSGTGKGVKVLFVLVATIACGLLSYLNLRVATSNDLVASLEEGKGVDEEEVKVGNGVVSCCASTCWVLVMILVALASINTIMYAAESQKFSEVVDGEYLDINGHEIFFRCAGSGSPTVYFEHGLGGNSLDFSWVQRNVSTITRTCAFDRAGYGFSLERGPLPRTSDQLAKESKMVLDKLNISEAIFVGHSFAGFNIRTLEAQYPEMFLGIVFVDMVNPNNTLACDPNQTYGSPLYQFGLYVVELGVMRILNLIGFLDSFAPIHLLPEDVQSQYKANLYRAGYFRTRVDEYMYWGKNCDYVKNLEGEQKALNVPVTVIAPAEGIHKGEMEFAREIADLSPNGTYFQVDDKEADHVSVLFNPKFAKVTTEAVLNMINQVRTTSD